MKIAGVVVLYNPDDLVYNNMNTYITDIDRLYIIDNSLESNEKKLGMLKSGNYEYHHLGKNKGLASALNIGCALALDAQYEYVLTMVQDASFKQGSLNQMKNSLGSDCQICGPSILIQYNEDNEIKEREKESYSEWLITAGTIMSLDAWNKVGRFDDDFFIEFIDIDLCLRFMINGYKLHRVKDAYISLMQGVCHQHYLGKKVVYTSDAAPLRTYYLFRNGTYIRVKYGKKYSSFVDAHYGRYIIKVILYEDNKIKKLINAFKGWVDGYKWAKLKK